VHRSVPDGRARDRHDPVRGKDHSVGQGKMPSPGSRRRSTIRTRKYEIR
jgi:hypothetical protein